jgi:hypothetical protein
MEISFVIYLFPIVAAFAVYLLKRQVDQLDRVLVEYKAAQVLLQADLQNVKNDYLHKNDFKDFKIELRSMFDELKSDIKSLRHVQ